MSTALRSKLISPEAAARLVKSGDWVEYSGALAQPDLFDRALAARKSELRDVKIRTVVSASPRAVLECDPTGEHFLWFNWHLSAYDRAKNLDGRVNYIPMNFGELPERAKIVIVETCEAMPYVYGEQESIHVSEVTHVIDGGRGALPELANPPVTEVDRTVAEIIAAEIEDGSCLQIGIGGMPNAVCSVLKDAGLRDLGIHTEMFVDGMVDLLEAGIVTGARKQMNPFQSIYTFALGSRRRPRRSRTASATSPERAASSSSCAAPPRRRAGSPSSVSPRRTKSAASEGAASSRHSRRATS